MRTLTNYSYIEHVTERCGQTLGTSSTYQHRKCPYQRMSGTITFVSYSCKLAFIVSLQMSSMRFSACFDTSHHGPPHPFKDAGVVADNLTQPQCYGGVSLRCQQELHIQGKNREDPNLTSIEAMQCVLFYPSYHDRCY
jgi:hypothetical protein